MKLDKDDRGELRRLAKAARDATGSGTWSQEEVGCCSAGVAVLDDDGYVENDVAECVEVEAATFIAAADPETVTELLNAADERDHLRSELNEARRALCEIRDVAPPGSSAEALAGKAAARIESAIATEAPHS